MNTMRKQARRNPVAWVLLCTVTLWTGTVFAVTRVAREQEPSSADEKVYSPDEVDVKARIKNRLDHLPARKNDCPDLLSRPQFRLVNRQLFEVVYSATE